MNVANITHADPQVQRACRRYAVTLLHRTNSCRRDGNVQDQVGRYLESTERYRLLALRVRAVLDECKVPLSASLPYRNFACKATKTINKFSSRTRHFMLIEAMTDAVAYGCDQRVLERICREVCGYDIEELGRELGMGV